jgi:cyclohexyl-isocyanide hydratase
VVETVRERSAASLAARAKIVERVAARLATAS